MYVLSYSLTSLTGLIIVPAKPESVVVAFTTTDRNLKKLFSLG